MIKLFRKIRQGMLSENKFSKYLIYAVGEIILVVIGILIAIALNNSNQNRSNTVDRETKLTKLRHVIFKDSIAFARSIENSEEAIIKVDSLQRMLNLETDFGEYKKFIQLFQEMTLRFRTFKPNTTVYHELINSASFSQIKNEELKENISNLYSYYDHFGELISAYINGFISTKNDLYGRGIISYKYFNLSQPEEIMQEGYREFKLLVKDPERLRIFENYLFSERELHVQIIGLYKTITYHFMNGLPVAPDMNQM